MKLLPKQTRVNTEDSLGHGMDAAIVLAMFFAGGYGLDRLFGTTPLFMIIMVIVGSVGIFAKFKYSYTARMEELENERLNRVAPSSSGRRSA
jgi:ATP synthase protein I